MKIYTSEEILALEDLYQVAEETTSNEIFYELTDGEIEWLRFIAGKYSIYDYITQNSFTTDDDGLVMLIDATEIGEALAADGLFCKAVCLSDDSALQRVFFWCAIEPDTE